LNYPGDNVDARGPAGGAQFRLSGYSLDEIFGNLYRLPAFFAQQGPDSPDTG
jgi:hypothetical protein